MVCCKLLLYGYRGKSPFTKVIITEGFNGGMEGCLQCDTCKKWWRFEVVDYDTPRGITVIVLGELRPEVADKIIEAGSKLSPPEWPYWHMRFEWDNAGNVTPFLDPLLSQALPPDRAVACSCFDDCVYGSSALHGHVVATPDSWIPTLKTEDWFAFLGCPDVS